MIYKMTNTREHKTLAVLTKQAIKPLLRLAPALFSHFICWCDKHVEDRGRKFKNNFMQECAFRWVGETKKECVNL